MGLVGLFWRAVERFDPNDTEFEADKSRIMTKFTSVINLSVGGATTDPCAFHPGSRKNLITVVCNRARQRDADNQGCICQRFKIQIPRKAIDWGFVLIWGRIIVVNFFKVSDKSRIPSTENLLPEVDNHGRSASGAPMTCGDYWDRNDCA
jgi:hypothetical protein